MWHCRLDQPHPTPTFSLVLLTAWGWTDEISDGGIHGIDGTGGDFPRYTIVEDNVFREIGVWEKQSSAFFQAKTAESTLRRNVVFNLARAGFNFVGLYAEREEGVSGESIDTSRCAAVLTQNDGFGGGDNVTENVLFNTCRESSDHGASLLNLPQMIRASLLPCYRLLFSSYLAHGVPRMSRSHQLVGPAALSHDRPHGQPFDANAMARRQPQYRDSQLRRLQGGG